VRKRLVVALVGLLVVVLVAAGLGWWLLGRGPTGPLADAFRTLPADSLRLGYTDWARVTEELDAPRGKKALDDEVMTEFLGRAYDADVTTTSAVVDSFPGLAANFGLTPADAEWEAYGQGREGAVDVLRLDDEVDLDKVAERLEEAGYDEPDDRDGVWVGSPELVAALDEPLTTMQQNVALLHDQRLLLMADDPTYLEQSLPVASGDEDSVMAKDGVPDLVDTVGDAESAQLWVGDFACEDLAMSKADAVDQREGDRLTEAAGGVHPLDGLVLARGSGRQATVAMWFATDAQAEEDLQPRTDLARGDAPGQGGTFADRFSVTEAVQDGRLVRLDLRARAGTLMSDLGQGSVLFATC
jgi:hypothetical protein